MFEIDKSAFGAFVASLRRERGVTQRELAAKVGVSDKAVSKWETGSSLPDIALLPPLAEELGVTVTELLNCRRMDSGETLRPQDTDELLRAALDLRPEEGRRPTRKSVLTFLLCAAVSAAELILLLVYLKWTPAEDITAMLWTGVILGAVFGAYFFLAVKPRLPKYYDENRIGYVTDGFLRLHLSGVRINNLNWPHLIKALRRFSAAAMLLSPALCYALDRLAPPPSPWRLAVFLTCFLGGLFVPVYYAAIKYKGGRK